MICFVRKEFCIPLLRPFIALNNLNKLSALVSDDHQEKIKEVSTNNIPKKVKSTNLTPVYFNKETKLKGQISFNVSKTNFINTNIALCCLEFWECVTKIIKTLSHKTEMEQSQLSVDFLKVQIENVLHAKKEKGIELDKLSSKLLEFPHEKSISLSHDNTSVNCLRLLAEESELQNEKRQLIDDIKALDDKEEEFFKKLLIAINDSSEKEHLYSKFIKTFFLTCAFLSLCLTAFALCIYNFNLMKDMKLAADKIKELNDQLRNAGSKPSTNQQTWGSYLKGFVRPLYSWALPKKQK